MKTLFLKDLFSYLLRLLKKAAPATLLVFIVLLYPLAYLYTNVWCRYFPLTSLSLSVSVLALLAAVHTVVFLICCATALQEDLPEYYRNLIKGRFHGFSRRTLLMHGIWSLTEDHDYQTALTDFKSLEDTDPDEHEIGVLGFYSAICYTGLGYHVHAANSAVRAVKAGVAEKEALLLAARGYANAGSYDQAREFYDVLCEIAEESYSYPTVFFEAGDVCIKGNRPEEAEAFFRRSIKNGLSVASSEGGMALACLMQKKSDEAVGWYRLALLNRIPDPDGFRAICTQICKACGLSPDHLDNALKG
ncbi:MAG: tetratricopeptide repeat protein [Oscillospiraceae bacterium]|nr:tetratricopeptide repeat protein [Oscillospiraceae bacterium]